jgi:FlaA1/EpsC-like NDP-sugar epimerase
MDAKTARARIVIRGFRNGEKVFQELVNATGEELAQLAQKHIAKLTGAPFMVEFEFLDEKDQNERFMRFGTDPRGMVAPFAVDLDTLKSDT